MLVLTVQFNQPVRQILERTGGGQRATDERAAAPLGRDLPPDDDLVVADLEQRFDRRQFGPGTDQILGRAATKQQPDGLDQNRFASPGLAGQDIERWFKFDGDRFDHCQVADGERADHGSRMSRDRVADKRGKSIVSGV